jgi:hypothetical protein
VKGAETLPAMGSGGTYKPHIWSHPWILKKNKFKFENRRKYLKYSYKQKVLGRTNSLFSFDTIRTA